METTTFNHAIETSYTERTSRQSILARLIKWCEGQENNRILWIGIALTGHGCVITPITIMLILLAGNSMVLFMLAMAAMGAVLVTNLAAMPTKITIPVFIFSILIDLGIIITCGFVGFNTANVF